MSQQGFLDLVQGVVQPVLKGQAPPPELTKLLISKVGSPHCYMRVFKGYLDGADGSERLSEAQHALHASTSDPLPHALLSLCLLLKGPSFSPPTPPLLVEPHAQTKTTLIAGPQLWHPGWRLHYQDPSGVQHSCACMIQLHECTSSRLALGASKLVWATQR